VDQTGEAIARDLLENRRDGLQASVFLLSLATFSGFWFLAFLHRRLAADTGSPEGWAALAGGVGLVVGAMALGTILSAALAVDSLTRDPDAAKTLWLLEHGTWVMIGPALAAFVLGVSVGAIRHGQPHRWFGWAGLVVTAVLLVNMWFGLGSPVVLGYVWVLAVAISLAIRLPQPGDVRPDRSVGAST
jgi:hypothetical protein